MGRRMCDVCEKQRPALRRPKTGQQVRASCLCEIASGCSDTKFGPPILRGGELSGAGGSQIRAYAERLVLYCRKVYEMFAFRLNPPSEVHGKLV